MFTAQQLLVIQDELRAPLRTDRVTHFSMRPPELRFVDNCVDYVRWFDRESVCPLFNPTKALASMEVSLDLDEEKCCWLDGFNYKITVRPAALRIVYEHAKERFRNLVRADPHQAIRVPTQGTLRVFGKLVWMFEGYDPNASFVYTRRTERVYKIFSDQFLSKNKARKLPVVWWTPVHPRRNTAFLIQLLLCMGHFNTEYELMLQGNMRGSYVEAGLFDTLQPSQSFHKVLSCYVLRHLRVQAGSTFQFDRNLTDAYNLIKGMLFPTAGPTQLLCTPAVLYSSIVRDTNENVTAHLNKIRRNYATALYGEIRNCGLVDIVPDMEEIINARDVPIAVSRITEFFPPPQHPMLNLCLDSRAWRWLTAVLTRVLPYSYCR
jgi:hypothetical protein